MVQYNKIMGTRKVEKYFALFFDCLSSCSNGNQLVELTKIATGDGCYQIRFKMVEQNLIQAGLAIQLHTFDQIDSTNAEAKRGSTNRQNHAAAGIYCESSNRWLWAFKSRFLFTKR